jgi:putative DNA primase/helicase
VNPQAIPEPLRRRDQWVVWRFEERDGKRTKVPYQAAAPGKRASSTDPSTWSSFERAGAVQGVAGVGYVFSAGDQFTGIDLDDCIDEVGEVHPAAAEILSKLDSYAERTPSGRGFHVFIEGKLIGRRNRTKATPWSGEIEIYDKGRFFTVTGTGSGVIRSAQPELDALIAEFLPPPDPPKSATADERPHPG